MTSALIEPEVSSHSLHDLKPGDHWCELYHHDQEHLALLKQFFADGLAQNHKLLYIAEPELARAQLAELEHAGPDIRAARERGQLVTCSPDAAYLVEGRFDRARMLQQWEQQCAAALAEGYTALRAAGEPTWALARVPGSEELPQYESELNDFAATHPCIIFCQYDARRFPANILLDVLRSHPVAVLDNAVLENPYFVPPEEARSDEREAARLARWVTHLREQQRDERRAQERAGARTSPGAARALRRLGALAGWAALALALLVLAGYASGIPLLTTFGGAVGARPAAAVGIALAAVALLLRLRARRGAIATRLWQACAAATALLGLLVLPEWMTGRSLGIDRLLFEAELRNWQPLYPGRMSLPTALDFVLLGAAVLLLDWEPRRGLRPAPWAAIAAAFISVVALQGYTFGVSTLSDFGLPIAMSLPAAFGLALLSWGALFARPDAGPMRVISSTQAGGAVLRWALPLTVGVILLLGWFSRWGLERGLYPDGVEAVVFALPLMLLFSFAFFELAEILNRAGERQEEQHLQLENFNRELETRVRERTRQLQQSEERYRSLVTATSQVVWVTDPEGWVEDMPMWRALTGQTEEQVRGWGWLDALHPDDRARVKVVWRTALGARSLYEVEYRIRAADGSWRHTSARGVPVLESDGTVREWVGTCNDITAQKDAQEAARQAERYVRGLLEASLDPLVTISRDGKITDVNAATEQITGKTRAELVGTDFSEYFTEPEAARRGYERVFAEGLVYDYPLAIRGGDHSTDVLYNACVFRNDAGEVEGVFAAARDVTARKRAESELRRLNRAYKALSRCSDAVTRAGSEGALLQEVCNLAVQVGGYRLVWVAYAQDDEEKSVRPMAFAGDGADYVANARITWADDERGQGPTGIALRSGEPCFLPDIVADPRMAPWRESALAHGYHSVMTAPLKDGERAFGTLNFYAAEPDAFDAEERGLVVELAATLSHAIVALRAREERDRAAAEVRALNENLERRVEERTAALAATNQELEAFTYSVAHDLRTPLRHIHGFVTLLAEDYAPQLDDTARDYVEHLVRGSQQMGRLIDDLLNLSRIGRQQLQPQVVGLDRVVEDVRAELAPDAGQRHVTWHVGELPFVECDAALVRQVFHNLLSNALKFTRPRDEALIEVGRMERDGETVLFVRDNGVGFNMKYADKLFGVFQRLHRQEDFEGTGVGLVTVQRIIHKHGGRIWAEAELDHGATFYFTLGPTVGAPAAQPITAAA